jgi:L-rhamnose isomerase
MYGEAQKEYAEWGIDTEKALTECTGIPVSIHCWQGDDLYGLEKGGAALGGGGIQTTGNYPGRARNKDELMADMDFALALIPGKKRINLHATYAITDKPVERDKVEPLHFDPWLDWAKNGSSA